MLDMLIEPRSAAICDSCSPVSKTLKLSSAIRRAGVNRLMAVVSMAGSWMLSGAIVRAQTTSSQQGTTHVISDQDLNLLRKDLRSKRKQLIAANLNLTDAEAANLQAGLRPVCNGVNCDQ